MEKDNLPNKLYVPGVASSIGIVDAQFKDPSGDMTVVAWGSKENAIRWLKNGGIELWEKEGFGLTSATKADVVLRDIEKSHLFMMHSDKHLHFEPEIGSLFSPTDRVISIT